MARPFAPTPKPILREIRKLQASDEQLMRRRPFERLVRAVARKKKGELLWREQAVDALQEASEAHLVSILREAGKLAAFSKRVTVLPRDIELAAERCA